LVAKRDRYPRPFVTVDAVIFALRDGDLQVLLVKRRHPPFQCGWAIPGGLIEMDETLEAAARRELQEETGLTGVSLEQLYTFGDPGRDPRGRSITVVYLAAVSAGSVAPRAGDDAAEVGWWSIYDLPPLAFDHDKILSHALTRLRYKLEYTAVGFSLLPEAFTLTELQAAYEIVLGVKLDKRNFRRRVLSAGIIEPAGGYRCGEGRPACLYRYRGDAAAEVKARRLFP
jgi:8-oxo-dGTP diphosphatase